MKARFQAFRPRTLALAISLAAASCSFADTYSETFEDKLSHCVEFQTGKWTLVMSGSTNADLSGLNNFSTVVITVGDVNFTAQLGNDCRYTPGKTSARVQQVVQLPGGGGALAMDAQLSWANGQYNIVLRGFPPLSGSPLGSQIYATGTPGLVSGTATASVNLGGTVFTSSIPANGTLTQKTKNSCSTSFTIKRVKLSGSN
jgi:hypothetical protein